MSRRFDRPIDPAPSKQTLDRCLLESFSIFVLPSRSVPRLPPPVLRRSLDPLQWRDIPACNYSLLSEPAVAARHTRRRRQNPSTNIRSQHPLRFAQLAVRHSHVVEAFSCAGSTLLSDTAGILVYDSPSILRGAAEYKSDSSHSEPEPRRALVGERRPVRDPSCLSYPA